MDLLGYARVSTDDQVENGHSLAQQRERLQAYAALHGHRLVDVIVDEGVSASVPLRKRPGGARLLAALRAGQGVVVVRLDRLFRSALDGLQFFADHTCAVHSVSELIDTTTPAGRLALTIQLGAAQYERDLAAQRATECNTALRKSGRVYGGIPFGCIRVGTQLYRDPQLWAVRERIVQLREQAGFSFRDIAAHLRQARVPAPNNSRSWSTSTIANVIKTHADLAHLPVSENGTPAASATPDTEASHAGHGRFH